MAVPEVGIQLNLKGYEGVLSDIRKLESMLRGFGSGKNRIILEADAAKAKAEILALKSKLDELKAAQKGFTKGSDEWKAFEAEIAATGEQLKRTTVYAKELSIALRNVKSFKQVFNEISSRVAHVGSAFQSAGNALTKLTSPFKRFTTGLLYGAGMKALNLVTSGFSGAFERYDTMHNYRKSLIALGLDADKKFAVGAGKAQTALENLNEAVLGLPTGLDEIVAAQKVYAGATGEMEKSTKTAIAANNTFLASGMGSREQRFMQKYLVSLASGAELTTTQWQSMGRIAPLAMRAVSEELGYAGKDYDKFTKDVQNGTIAGEKFLEAFIKVGTEGKVQAAANVMKTTWEGLSANIQNASKRMGEAILNTLDEVFVAYNGRNLVQNLLGFDADGNEIGGGIKHFINSISEALQEWVRANPDKIIEFFDAVKSVDWKALLSGLAEGMLAYLNVMKGILNFLGRHDGFTNFLGKFMVFGNMIGKSLTIAGGLMKGTRHLWGFLGAVAITKFGGGLIGRIFSFFGGKNAMKTIAQAPTFAQTLRATFASLKGLFVVAGSVLTVAGTAWASIKALKSIIKDLGEIGDLVHQVDWWSAIPAVEGFGIFITAFAGLGKLLSAGSLEILKDTAVLGAITTLAAGIARLDMELIKGSFAAFRDIANLLKEAVDSFGEIGAISKGDGILNRIDAAVNLFNEIKKRISIKKSAKGMEIGKLDELDMKTATSISNYANSVKALKEAIDSLNEINAVELNIENIEKITTDMSDAMLYVSTLYDKMPKNLKKKGTKGGAETLVGILQYLKSALNEMVGDGGVLALIPQVTESIQGIITNDPDFATFSANMQAFADGMSEGFMYLVGAFADIQPTTLVTNAENLKLTIESLRGAAKQLNKLSKGDYDISGGLAIIASMQESLRNTFSSEDFTSFVSNIERFTRDLTDLLTAMQNLSEELVLEVKVSLKNGKVIGAAEVVKTIKKANKDIKNAVDGIKTNYQKTITVTLLGRIADSATSSLTTGLKAHGDAINKLVNQQHGGLIYRAKGGSVFKPRGTDTIPAMLTKGEFVQRKQAVDTFGLDFMRKVNALDVRGAMQALMSRGSLVSTMNRSNVTNNIINNNQRVTQNINSSNPNMATMSLGRFAGAL